MKQFPIVRASGTHYEAGRAVGAVMKRPIAKLFAKNQSEHPEYFLRFRQQSDELFDLTQKYFPQYIEELRGVADGAGFTPEEFFLSNGIELGYFGEPKSADHCTIIAVPSGNGYLVGHNEDWEEKALEHLFLLDAEIEGVRLFGLGYDFTNTIIGDSVAVNRYGLLEAINEVSHTDKSVGVPKAFIARALMDCRSLEDAEAVIQSVRRRSGFNHFIIKNDRLWNIETSAKEYGIEKIVLQKYVHTNHYVTELRRIDRGNPDSEKRYGKVASQMSSINSVDDIKRLLSDQSDPPICRPGTIGSVIFDLPNKIAHIACGQPTPESYVEYSLASVLE